MSRKHCRVYFQQLKRRLPSDFKFVQATESFEQVFEEGAYIFQTRCIAMGATLAVDLAVGIRIKEVEEIFCRSFEISEEFHGQQYTIGSRLSDLLGGDWKSCMLPLNSDEEVVDSIVATERLFESVALPYFERYSTVNAIAELLNAEPHAKSPHAAVMYRGAVALIAARISKRQDFEELVSIYRAELARLQKGFYLPKFDNLVSELRAM